MKDSGRRAGTPLLRHSVLVVLAGVATLGGLLAWNSPGRAAPPDPQGRWASGTERIEFRADGRLGEVAVSPSICTGRRADGRPVSDYRGTWKAGHLDDAGDGVYVVLDGLLDSGQPCQTFLQFLKDGDEYTLVATSERATQDRFRRV